MCFDFLGVCTAESFFSFLFFVFSNMCRVYRDSARPVSQGNIAASAVGPLAAALAGSTAFPGGNTLQGIGLPGNPAGLGVALSAPALAANKVMRELHVGGLPQGVSGQQLQVTTRIFYVLLDSFPQVVC